MRPLPGTEDMICNGAEFRRQAIAESGKPIARVIDFVGTPEAATSANCQILHVGSRSRTNTPRDALAPRGAELIKMAIDNDTTIARSDRLTRTLSHQSVALRIWSTQLLGENFLRWR